VFYYLVNWLVRCRRGRVTNIQERKGEREREREREKERNYQSITLRKKFKSSFF
jgi:ferric-dicitrate binding protein FerR (iron transport regulator)